MSKKKDVPGTGIFPGNVSSLGAPTSQSFGLSSVQKYGRSAEGEPGVFLKNALGGSRIPRSVLKEASRNFPKTLDLSTL